MPAVHHQDINMLRIIALINIWTATVFAQQPADLTVRAVLNNQPIQLNRSLEWKDSSFTFTTLKCYITQRHVNQTTNASVDLLDWSDGEPKMKVAQPIDQTAFFFGTDSLTNVSGNIDGPLDPINGMYWAWNSGYINFKLEGYWGTHYDQPIEFHIGGYRKPYATFLPFTENPTLTTRLLVIDVTHLLQYISDQHLNGIMVPGESANSFTNQLIHCFQFQ